MSGADDPLRYFRVEARDIAEELGRDVLRLEAAPAADVVQRLLRLAHTLKGAARVVKQREIAERAHAIEEILAPLRDGGTVGRDAIERLLRHVDTIAAQAATLNAPATPQPMADEPALTPRADTTELEILYDGIAEASQQLRALRDGVAALAGVHSGLIAGFDRAEREIAAARDAAAKLRLAPAAGIFAALERTARDIAQAQDKETVFAATGGEIRLDAAVLGTVRGALIQLVRNAVAHGIEPAAERLRRGKPAAGRVTLEVARHHRRIAFICDDDGGGIDLEMVRSVAQTRGAAPDALALLDAQGLIQLLLRGGLSTAAKTSELAGRGIGLDVVREAAGRLGGEVRVETEPGRGTRVELSVPVSLSTLDALLVETDGTVAAVPLGAVRRTFRITPDIVARGAGRDTVPHDGAAIPLVPLAAVLRRAPRQTPVAPRFGVIVAGAGAAAALGIARLLEVATLVVQPLPAAVRAEALVAGASLDAEGTPRLVLDPEALVAAAHAAGPSVVAAAAPKSPILVVDDSLTTRMLEQSILESAGFDVDLAVSAEDALGKAAQRRYALFLVDVEMPGMDGFAFVARTRADFRDTPALLVSSRNGAEDRRRAVEAGASGYIVKGEFDQIHFLDTVRRLAG
jgi:two-component system chemotaxis sensor kinase CheA